MNKEQKQRTWDVFLKRLPAEHLNDKSKGNFISTLKQCIEIVEMFEKEVDNETNKNSSN